MTKRRPSRNAAQGSNGRRERPGVSSGDAFAGVSVEEGCDLVVDRALALMLEHGASVSLALDRMLTHCAGYAAAVDGSAHAAASFRQMADRIEAGLFHCITGEGGQRH